MIEADLFQQHRKRRKSGLPFVFLPFLKRAAGESNLAPLR